MLGILADTNHDDEADGNQDDEQQGERTPLLNNRTNSSSSSNSRRHHQRIVAVTTTLSNDTTRHDILIRNVSVDSLISNNNNNNNDINNSNLNEQQQQQAFEASNNTTTNSASAAQINSAAATTSSDFNQKFQRCIDKNYPRLFVLIHSILSILMCACMITCERLQSNRFTLDDLQVLSYKTLNGLILWAAAVNIAYSTLALFTILKRKYFLIQLSAILNLIASVASFVYFILFNILILILSLMDDCSSDYKCVLLRSSMIVVGVVVTVLNVTFYLIIQINFLNNLNKNQFFFAATNHHHHHHHHHHQPNNNSGNFGASISNSFE